MRTYQEKKNAAREEAAEWQEYIAQQSLSYEAFAVARSHFEWLGRRYGLLKEFRENGVY